MLRTVPAVLTVVLSLFATSAVAQTAVDTAIATSNSQISNGNYSEARQTIIAALNAGPGSADRGRLTAQLDKVSNAIPYFISLGLNSEITTGTRQSIFEDRLNWTGVPHYTDDTLAVEASQSGQINELEIGAGYRIELTPDLGLTLGIEGEINFYEGTDFMEAWIGEAFTELDLSFGPILSNTRLSYAISSKSREKDDANPNVPRVPGAYHLSAEQDVGYKITKGQVVGAEFTYRMGDETENVQFPGTRYDHFTLEAYYDALWADTLGTRVYGYAQGATTDPEYTGFQAFGGGVEMGMDLPLGFGLAGDLEYRLQNGNAPYPSRTENLDIETLKGSVEVSNGHYTLRGLEPFLNARFDDSTATYTEYDESNIAFGAGIRLGF